MCMTVLKMHSTCKHKINVTEVYAKCVDRMHVLVSKVEIISLI